MGKGLANTGSCHVNEVTPDLSEKNFFKMVL
jgi:hypothetical protein